MYSEKVLSKFGLNDYNSAATPLELGDKLFENCGPTNDFARIEGVGYKCATGSLLYFTFGTRPDLSAVVNSLCRYS